MCLDKFEKIIMVYNIYKNAAITTNSQKCAAAARAILQQGGSVADAAIASLLCGGVRNPERMGIGGGFIMTIYHRANKKAEVLIARERAPGKATRDMYKGKKNLSMFGGLAVAVPGSLRGYWHLHKRYGKLPWSKLFENAISLCQNGVEVEPFTSQGLQQLKQDIMKSPSLKNILVDNSTGLMKREKQKIFRPKLAKTLALVAKHGPDVLYDGELTETFLRDIKSEGGIITHEDMAQYKVKWTEPVSIKLFDNYIAYSVPPPASGAVLFLILNILSRLKQCSNTVDYWHKIIEAWKFAFAFRTRLGDPDFAENIEQIVEEMLSPQTAHKIRNKIRSYDISNDYKNYGAEYYTTDDKGTAHMNIVSENGDAIAVTETINALFGAMLKSESTGIILNNSMNDFCLPEVVNNFGILPSKANFIEPGKIPLSSMAPVIITDEAGNVKMVAGAAGGTKIITSLSMVILNYLLLKVNLNTAINDLRLHHQLMPMKVLYEPGFSENILNKLEEMGYQVSRMRRFSTVSVISKKKDGLHVKGDHRRHAGIAGY